MPFTSPEAKQLNKDIFETMYYAALASSKDMAVQHGPYETFAGSPLSEGKFQFNLWGVDESELSGRWDWKALRQEIMKHGVRNSLLMAPMPTASTSQILGNNECFEPYTSNIYTRRVLSGEFIVVNKHLLLDLVNLGLWNDDIKNDLLRANGSIQDIDAIPANIKELYKTVWEMSMRDIIDMAADRGVFIDQSQSLNLFMENPNAGKLTSMHFYAWKKGLKTGMYYLRSKAASSAIKFTVSKTAKPETEPAAAAKAEVIDFGNQPAKTAVASAPNTEVKHMVGAIADVNQVAMPKAPGTYTEEEMIACSIDNPDACEACGS
jgi:ribonucleoside-diphosphate reductase alpha chain